MKKCKQCLTSKPESEFYKQKASRDGLQHMCKKCTETNRVAFDAKCLEQGRVSRASLGRYALRMEVLNHYSGGTLKCTCPGCETPAGHMEFLAIDHEGKTGAAHRKEVGKSAVYRWLKRQGFPKGFRVLCHNCNSAHGYYGFCPHEHPELSKSNHGLLTNKQRSEEKLLKAAADVAAKGMTPSLKVLKREVGLPISFSSAVRGRLKKAGKWPYHVDPKWTPRHLLQNKS